MPVNYNKINTKLTNTKSKFSRVVTNYTQTSTNFAKISKSKKNPNPNPNPNWQNQAREIGSYIPYSERNTRNRWARRREPSGAQ